MENKHTLRYLTCSIDSCARAPVWMCLCTFMTYTKITSDEVVLALASDGVALALASDGVALTLASDGAALTLVCVCVCVCVYVCMCVCLCTWSWPRGCDSANWPRPFGCWTWTWLWSLRLDKYNTADTAFFLRNGSFCRYCVFHHQELLFCLLTQKYKETKFHTICG